MSALSLVGAAVPQKLRTPLKRWIYARVPLEKRMGKAYWQMKTFLKDAQWWEGQPIEAWQLNKLQEMVLYAYENVPGYHALYQDAGVKPNDIVTLTDVQLLPFTTKELLRDNLKDFTSRSVPAWQRRYVTTGGSTGIPFGFYHSDTNTWMEDAFMHSGWERAGWQLGDSSAVLRGGFIGSEERFWDYDPSVQDLLLSSYYLTDRTYSGYVTKIEEYRPKHLQAYPSAALLLADLTISKGEIGRITFDVILLGSENIYDWQRAKLKAAFPHSRLFAWYGHAEQVMLAPWCEETSTYHVWPFYGMTEILTEEDREASTGEVGEIVGTSFWANATPFIRYRTMDFARKGRWGCPDCKRQGLTLETIEGRLQEIILTSTGRKISMTAINMHSDVFDNLRQFQFFQDTPGEVVFRMIPKDSYTEADTDKIRRELLKKLGEDTQLEIEFVKKITRTQRGKLRFLEQKLEIR